MQIRPCVRLRKRLDLLFNKVIANASLKSEAFAV